jgi:hypothetical protein
MRRTWYGFSSGAQGQSFSDAISRGPNLWILDYEGFNCLQSADHAKDFYLMNIVCVKMLKSCSI